MVAASQWAAPAGEPVSFIVAPDDPDEAGDVWLDFGDGVVEQLGFGTGARTTTHAYAVPGRYRVTAILIDATGAETRRTIDVVAAAVRGVEIAETTPEAPIDPVPDRVEDSPAFSLSEVTWLHTDVSQWAETSEITGVRITGSQVCIDHTKAGRWPVIQGGEGNPWVLARIDGRWYAGTYEWLKPGQVCKGVTRHDIGPHVKQPPLDGWRPQTGELVGFMVSTHARFGQDGIAERSNVHFTHWP